MIFNENSIINFQSNRIALLTANYKYRDPKCCTFYRDKYNIQKSRPLCEHLTCCKHIICRNFYQTMALPKKVQNVQQNIAKC